jgi:hypothetical protein
MTVRPHLIGFAITPVQAFIREGRKAQDTWSGSLLLSYMARQALQALYDGGATPVSPVVLGPDAVPADRPSVTNEGVVRFEGGTEGAEGLARQAAEAARSWWSDVACQTRQQLVNEGLFQAEELTGPREQAAAEQSDRWQEQIDRQFQVVWAVMPEEGSAEQALEGLHRLLGAAKRARQIEPYRGDNRPKCSLCGAWEQMGPVAGRPGDATRLARQFWAETFPSRLRSLPSSNDLRWAVTARIEPDGRERLCAVCLTRRLGPVLVLRTQLGFRSPTAEDSELRFPSTHAVAWVEQKERLVALARQDPDRFLSVLCQFNKSVEYLCQRTGLPRGRHVLACHEGILHGLTGNLQAALRTFLRFDGSWLDEGERERDEPARRRRAVSPNEEAQLWADLDVSRRRLQETADKVSPQRVRLGRTPPVALLRADADRLGRLQGEAVRAGGLERATQLSDALARHVLQAAVDVVEKDCRGKVIFAGGDELLALLPAAYALQAAAGVARAYERHEFPKLTASVAIVVTDPRQPLRASLSELTTLLEAAKNHTRRCTWHGDPRHRIGEEFSREAFGLAVIPGSGNVKRGVVGLRVPRYQAGTIQTCNALTDVLLPLAEALALPSEGRVSISPRLYREWAELFDIEDVHQTHLPAELLPANGDGIALAEFRRLARRHLMIREKVELDEFSRDWLRRLTSQDTIESEELSEVVAEGLTDRLRSLLLSGSVDHDTSHDDAAWTNVRGLLLGLTALGTREIR